MLKLLFICVMVFVCWKILIIFIGLFIQIFVFLFRLLCLILIVAAIYYGAKIFGFTDPVGHQSLNTLQHSYAIPVPGKSGYVMSPYSNKGYIAIKDHPSHTVIKDPYSTNNLILP